VRGDFSDVKFDSRNHYSRVLKQQGRVQLDSDDNEQAEIFLHYLRTFTADLLHRPGAGYSAACPASLPNSFKVDAVRNASGVLTDLTIQPGHYYVDGILCELEASSPLSYRNQPDYILAEEAGLPGTPFLVFFDVWERFVSAAENDSIREVALGGPDTAGRSHVVWQVRAATIPAGDDCAQGLLHVTATLEPADRGRLRVRAGREPASDNPCLVPPDARYRGEENQLYRVEIHRGGAAWDGNEAEAAKGSAATFVWSRDNGSNAFPIASFNGQEVTLETLGRDTRTGLQEGDLVEVQYERYVLGDMLLATSPATLRNPPPLLEVTSIDPDEFRVTLEGNLADVDDLRDSARLLRRWDRRPGATTQQTGVAKDGSTLIVESSDEDDGWIELENGIEIQFADSSAPATYRSGDYWLIPARVADNDVRWEHDENGKLLAEPPRGVEHRYAPLAIVTETSVTDCRTSFELISKSPPAP
jgi:hypothetical protein